MQVLRKPQVARKVGVSVPTIERWTSDPRFAELRFPKPFKIGLNSIGWDSAAVDAWLEARAAAREPASAA